MSKLTKQDFEKIKYEYKKKEGDWIKVGYSSCGIAAGADDVFNVLSEEIKKRGLGIALKKAGCAGMCYAEPLVEVNVKDMPRVLYGKIDKEKALKIIEKHVCGKMLVNDHIFLK